MTCLLEKLTIPETEFSNPEDASGVIPWDEIQASPESYYNTSLIHSKLADPSTLSTIEALLLADELSKLGSSPLFLRKRSFSLTNALYTFPADTLNDGDDPGSISIHLGDSVSDTTPGESASSNKIQLLNPNLTLKFINLQMHVHQKPPMLIMPSLHPRKMNQQIALRFALILRLIRNHLHLGIRLIFHKISTPLPYPRPVYTMSMQ